MEHKIIFTGPVGAGKTTAIASLSDIPVVATEAKATDAVQQRKNNTTVAMDYGILNLDGGAKVHLYGTPGQERFSFMWDILTVGGLGLVLLIDNGREDPLADLEFYLDAFKRFIDKNGVVIGVTRMDVKPRPGLYSYHTKLKELGVKAPVFEVDARDRDDIKLMMISLLSLLDPGLRR
jgi:signal recognition particle receptor subunit beta